MHEIFNYEITPATLANTFMFILQGTVQCTRRFGGVVVHFTVIWSQIISVCNTQ